LGRVPIRLDRLSDGRRTLAGPPARPRDRSERSPIITRTAFVSTYPPRRCGIASFTQDLARATGGAEIVALHPDDTGSPYPHEVRHRIHKHARADYTATARALSGSVDVVSVQHEYGIWGGDDGAYVLDFVRALSVPAVATLHTVLRHPTAHQRSVLAEVVALTAATAVMSRSAARLLTTAYGVDPGRLDIIPHGVPDLPLIDADTVKPSLGVADRAVVLSFGLLGQGKGYELAIDALPEVVATHPSALYVVVGATHPDLVRHEGEAYRRSLEVQVRRLGMEEHVRFVDRFVGKAELSRWLEAADVFVTPYPQLDQIVSGTLSYAMGAGRAVVSTPYAYAAELLADGRGVLVPPGSPSTLAAALNEVLGDRDLRAAIGRRAYAYSRRMVWPAVGAEYRRLFARVTAGAPMTRRALTPVVVGA
jgi:glycosyltransferase involved in cell wall biosynthesis